MRIKLIKSLWHDGVTHPIDATLDVTKDWGEHLIAKKKALKSPPLALKKKDK